MMGMKKRMKRGGSVKKRMKKKKRVKKNDGGSLRAVPEAVSYTHLRAHET